MKLTTKEKFRALKVLSHDTHIGMTDDGSWYVNVPHVEVKKGSILASASSFGDTVEYAINSCFDDLTTLPHDKYVVKNAMSKKDRKAFLWNGFMWEQIDEKVYN